MVSIAQRLAEELGVKQSQVDAAVDLLDGGATVPFIARYRKEATGALDDTQLRLLEERLGYLRELEDRRAAILKSIAEQDKLTPALEADIKAADTKTRLEDLYRPYMPKRRTKAQIAREAGLEPLAMGLLQDPELDPQHEAQRYVDADKGVADGAAALDGARQILMELFSEDAELVGELREYAWDRGRLQSTVVAGKEQEGAKFADYFAAMEPIKSIPSHRALAMFRGQGEGVLSLKLLIDEVDDDGEPRPGPSVAEAMIARRFGLRSAGRPADAWLADSARWAWRVKLSLHVELEMKKRLREGAEAEAIQVFAHNLKDLLLAAPAGPRATMGLDPGIRTGVKVAVVDGTGKLVDTATIYPHAPKKQWDQSIATLAGLARKHRVELVSIGNGTASRETDRLVADLIKRHPELGLTKIMVSEAGASVYSASETAAREFPDLDVSLRGAASIARRLQDPLAELVKIEPKSIGVGQYQHDVGQARLARTLDNVVEDCVNAVGVDVNTASVPLLARVSGLGPGLAENIVAHRNDHGPFRDRRQFTEVQRLGPKAFEQAAGFLRIMNGDNPLDASSVHPEAYPVVERILAASARDIAQLIGDSRYLRGLSANDFTDDTFGTPTVRDILAELEKPGRDPRPEFRTAAFREGVERMEDLKPGMRLEGVVTNVANFGAFVDIGVHQDGLVHISALADRFVSDPRTVVKAGDIVTVTVLDVDLKRKRIALTMRKDGGAPAAEGGSAAPPPRERPRKPRRERPAAPPVNTAMADALAKLRR
ncbi:MAG: Tex family protein [Gammaproteobacteria bacterium]|jgi:protein Tex